MTGAGPHLEDLFRYLDDEQQPDERQRFLDHLETCEACRDAMNRFRNTCAALQQAGPAPEPDERWASVEDAVIAEVAAGSRPGRGRGGRIALVLAATGALAAAAAAALVLFGERIEGTEPGGGGEAPSLVGPGMRIADASGAIEARDAAGRSVRAAPGATLGPRTRLTLDAGAEVMLELVSGGLQAHAQGPGLLLVHSVQPELARLDLFQGDMVLRVEGPHRPSTVEVGTPDGMVTVSGTVFGVQHLDESGSAIAVLRGRVRVTPAMDSDVEVEAGFRLSVRGMRLARIEPAEWLGLGRRVGLQGPAPQLRPERWPARHLGPPAGAEPAGEEIAPAEEPMPAAGEAAAPGEPPVEENKPGGPGQRERDIQQFLEQGEEYRRDLDR